MAKVFLIGIASVRNIKSKEVIIKIIEKMISIILKVLNKNPFRNRSDINLLILKTKLEIHRKR